ncbi:MAG: hypothetical protein HYR68_05760 [Burkholderiales bacterium]|nr:hypothetical protein [Burkholderiales bacterium]MBI3728919.1 hypothetical protein [Burkholderiales bacterium]
MRAAQIRRHLGAMNQPKGLPVPGTQKEWLGGVNLLSAESISPQPGVQSQSQKPTLNLEFSPRDYVTYLLSIDAGIKHCLMVQYLHAAYSLGGPQLPDAYRDAVRNWQRVIPGIAQGRDGAFDLCATFAAADWCVAAYGT